jgi:hypothetical protein
MRIECNRYNSARMIGHSHSWGNGLSHNTRWQVTVTDKRGRHYDHFFVCKPTRKQISKLRK